MILVLVVPSIYSVSAQSDIENAMDKKYHMRKVPDLDNMLTLTITATLTGLSLTGGIFLVKMTPQKKIFDFSSNTIKYLIQNGYDDVVEYIGTNFDHQYLKNAGLQQGKNKHE